MKSINKISNIKKNNDMLLKEYNEAKKDPDFKKMIDSIDLEEEVLMKYTSKIKQAVTESNNYKKDKKCLLNEMPGFIFTPYVVDGILNFKYKACE